MTSSLLEASFFFHINVDGGGGGAVQVSCPLPLNSGQVRRERIGSIWRQCWLKDLGEGGGGDDDDGDHSPLSGPKGEFRLQGRKEGRLPRDFKFEVLFIFLTPSPFLLC